MEGVVYSHNVQNKDCNGCKRFESDIMVTFTIRGSKTFHDFFLSNDQAEELIKDLKKQLAWNKEEPKT